MVACMSPFESAFMLFLALLAALAVWIRFMQVSSMHFKARAGEKLADVKLQAALRKLQGNFVKGRADRIAELDNFQDIRTRGRGDPRPRAGQSRCLSRGLREQRHRARRGGALGGDRRRTSTASCANSRRATACARRSKSKSMVSEECALNDALEAAGIEVVETDLGEYILQLAQRAAVAHRRAGGAQEQATKSPICSRKNTAAAQDRHCRAVPRGARAAARRISCRPTWASPAPISSSPKPARR